MKWILSTGNIHYLDDGILAGNKSSNLRSLSSIQKLQRTSWPINVNISKSNIYCPGDTSSFSSELKVPHLPHFEILVCPIGDYIYYANFIASVKMSYLRYLTCSTPTKLAFKFFDDNVCNSFMECVGFATSDDACTVSSPIYK